MAKYNPPRPLPGAQPLPGTATGSHTGSSGIKIPEFMSGLVPDSIKRKQPIRTQSGTRVGASSDQHGQFIPGRPVNPMLRREDVSLMPGSFQGNFRDPLGTFSGRHGPAPAREVGISAQGAVGGNQAATAPSGAQIILPYGFQGAVPDSLKPQVAPGGGGYVPATGSTMLPDPSVLPETTVVPEYSAPADYDYGGSGGSVDFKDPDWNPGLPYKEGGYGLGDVLNPNMAMDTGDWYKTGFNYAENYPSEYLGMATQAPDGTVLPQIAGYYVHNGRYYPINLKEVAQSRNLPSWKQFNAKGKIRRPRRNNNNNNGGGGAIPGENDNFFMDALNWKVD